MYARPCVIYVHTCTQELTPLLRCLELLPHLASEMPRFKGDKSKGLADDVLRKGMKLFKKGDTGGKGLPDEILAVLQRLLPSLGPAAAVAAAPLYKPPAGLPTPQVYTYAWPIYGEWHRHQMRSCCTYTMALLALPTLY